MLLLYLLDEVTSFTVSLNTPSPAPHPSPDHQLVKPVPLTAPLQRWRHRGAEMQRGAIGAVGGGGPMKDTAPWVAER